MGKTSPRPSDKELIESYRKGNYQALDQLLSRYQRQIRQVALRMIPQKSDVEEVIQQTYLNVVSHLDQFRGEAGFGTWLHKIVTNQARQWLRSRATRPVVSLDAGAEPDSSEWRAGGLDWDESAALPEEIAEEREDRQRLTEAIDELDPKYALVLVLRDREGFSTAETAERLGLTPENVKVRLSRARAMLRKKFQKAVPSSDVDQEE